jgi:serine/threonine protein kinase
LDNYLKNLPRNLTEQEAKNIFR